MIELRLRIEQSSPKPHLIMITEVQPKNSRYTLTAAEIDIEGYTTHTKMDSKGRGTMIYTMDHLIARMETMNTEFQESTWVRIRASRTEELLVGCIYRSPNSSHENTHQLHKLIREASHVRNTHVLIAGDFNYPGIEWQSWTTREENTDGEEYRFIETMRDCYLYQHVNSETRGRGANKPNLLDLILTNEEGMVTNMQHESPLGKSDHCTLVFDYNCYTEGDNKAKKKYYYDRGDYNQMRDEMDIDWDDKLETHQEDPGSQWNIFTKLLKAASDKHIPSKTISEKHKKRRGAPIDLKTYQATKKKHRTWQRYMETRDPAKYKEYTRQRNKVRTMTRKLQRDLEKEISRTAKENPKKFWGYVKSKMKTKTGIADLIKKKDGNHEELTKTDQEKAEVLADFFSSVFTLEPDTEIPKLEEKNYHDPLMNMLITQEEVQKKLLKLKTDKSQGPDEIHPRILKELAEPASKALSIIYRSSLKVGHLPEIWKRAQVTAIYKKGSKKDPCNYRPVSLTCIACKVMESLIRDRIMTHMKDNNLLSNRQYGFIEGRSTALQMLKVMDEWTAILDSGGELDVIYLDFMKAFDTVPHKRLISKMRTYGIDGQILQWTGAFLTGRTQRAAVNGSFSTWMDVLSGIPQGSVLGPLLFVIYINDLPDRLISPTFMFADDTKIFREVTCQGDQEILQDDLNALQSWSNEWLLRFHPDKCKVMTVTRKKNPEQRKYIMKKNTSTEIATTDHVLTNVESEKDLGITVDKRLSFEQHISDKVNKANQMMGVVRRSFTYLDPENFRWLFKAIVRPHLEYANVVWSPMRKKDVTTIENVQRRATKMIPGFNKMSYPDRLQKLGLPTLAYRRLRGEAIEVYKITTNVYDRAAIPELQMHDSSSSTTRGHRYKLKKIRSTTRLRQHFFTQRVTDLWNNLPKSVVEAPSTKSFERRLDKYWEDQEVKYNYEAALSFSGQNTQNLSDTDGDLDTQA